MSFLLLAAVFAGLLTALVFRLTVDTAALHITIRQIQAHFLEFRLFFEEPKLIWRAQKDLIRANGRALRTLLVPTVILALPMVWIIEQLEIAPLRVGESSVVTAQLLRGDEPFSLQAPSGIEVQTPPVRITMDRQLVWSIRPSRPITGNLRFTMAGVVLTRSISVGTRGTFLLHRREARESVPWLEVDYPSASYWWVFWFFVISSFTTLLVTRSGALARVRYALPSKQAIDSPAVLRR